jgi:hypothetical protein
MKKILTMIIICILCLSTFSILAPHAKATSLPPVGYWKFDEGSGGIAYDYSGNGNDGVIHTATWTAGKIGNALHFNGVDSWVEIPNSPTLTGLSQITLEAWIKEESIPSQPNGIISKCDGWAPPTNAEYFLGTVDGGRVFFETDNGVAIFSSQSTQLITEVVRWYHVAGTWSGNSYVIYVDGQQVLSGTCTPQTTRSNTLPVQIGRHGDWPWVYFQGIIDEVKIYNYARTPGEILTDYQTATSAHALHFSGADDLVGNDGVTAYTFTNKEANLYLQLAAAAGDIPSGEPNPNPITGNPVLEGAYAWCLFTPESTLKGPFTVVFPAVMNYQYLLTGIAYGSVRAEIDIKEQGQSNIIARGVGYFEDFWSLGYGSGEKHDYPIDISYTFDNVILSAGKTYDVEISWDTHGAILLGQYLFYDSQIYNGASFWARLQLFQPYINTQESTPPSLSQNIPSGLAIISHSPVAMLVLDPSGRKIGFDPTTGSFVNEIQGAYYSGVNVEPQFMAIPFPILGTYQIELYGTGSGTYKLTTEYIISGKTTTQTFNGIISPQETKYYSTSISDTGQITLISWEYVFKDLKRGTMLKISPDDKYFQFTAPNKDFGVKRDPKMKVLKNVITIDFCDRDILLKAVAIVGRFNSCVAVAWDRQRCKMYTLIC